ncbi:aspartate kinase [Anaplasma capra]|uniref:aspartate kinase n=1 Tax=Anaplasma capra TaxID=1562740 RepID=UPI0021D5C2AE|nr:aspartate kinase [Anaplasma capra]MCU7611806.1 aspartate kinase [Anaplasma capra]MCU7612649.1 aspartate kinase [Anaplasma capra]
MGRILVKKFGGTSLKNIECILRVAGIVQQYVERGYRLVVVVSAMGGFTDEVVASAREVADLASGTQLSEYDVAVSSGEQISCGLLALALQNKNIKAKSRMGWQVPIKTTAEHSRARITEIDADSLLKLLNEYEVVVVAGFQGVHDSHITTLGRGGSDTSAVAIAAALNLDTCYVYTDVTGVYTADPSLVLNARKLNHVTYNDMVEMSASGGAILHAHSVEIAMRHGVRIYALSTFQETKGTLVSFEREEEMESKIITGITASKKIACASLIQVPATRGMAAVLSPIAENNIDVDIITQTMCGEFCNITFTVREEDLHKIQDILTRHRNSIMYERLMVIDNLAKVSLVGTCMISRPGVASRVFNALANSDIAVLAVSTSEMKITVLIDAQNAESALNLLHTEFALDRESVPCV